jgi:hypothetical protein
MTSWRQAKRPADYQRPPRRPITRSSFRHAQLARLSEGKLRRMSGKAMLTRKRSRITTKTAIARTTKALQGDLAADASPVTPPISWVDMGEGSSHPRLWTSHGTASKARPRCYSPYPRQYRQTVGRGLSRPRSVFAGNRDLTHAGDAPQRGGRGLLVATLDEDVEGSERAAAAARLGDVRRPGHGNRRRHRTGNEAATVLAA